MNWIQYTHPRSSRVFSFTKTFAITMGTLARYKAVNSLLKEGAEAYNYHFMDCWPWLTDKNGEVDSKLFISDMLHLNAKGNGRLGYHISEIIRNAHPEEKTLNVFVLTNGT